MHSTRAHVQLVGKMMLDNLVVNNSDVEVIRESIRYVPPATPHFPRHGDDRHCYLPRYFAACLATGTALRSFQGPTRSTHRLT